MPTWTMVAACPFQECGYTKVCRNGIKQQIKCEQPSAAERDHLMGRLANHLNTVHYEDVATERDQNLHAHDAVANAVIYDDGSEEDYAADNQCNRAKSRSPRRGPPSSRASCSSAPSGSTHLVSPGNVKHLSTASLVALLHETRAELQRRDPTGLSKIDRRDL